MPYHQKSTFAAIDLEDNELIDQQNIADDTDYIPDHTFTDDHAYDEEDVNDDVAKVHSLNQCSKCKRVN